MRNDQVPSDDAFVEKASHETRIHRNEAKINTKDRLVLIPQPSDDERDPLNWSFAKKHLSLAVLCFTAFAATLAPTCHQTAYLDIAQTYHRSPAELSYSIPAAVAGLLGGPFLLAPLAKPIGRTALIFWSLLGVIATQIWSATATSTDDYISFTISRLMSGVFASVITIMGSGYIMDIFFLHRRGLQAGLENAHLWLTESSAFASFELSYLFGITASPTIGGFIVDSHPWPLVFWWTLAPLGLAVVLVAAFAEDTEFAPGRSAVFVARNLPGSSSYLKRRIFTLLGLGVTPPCSVSEVLRQAARPFIIGATPVTMLTGFYTLVNFSWAILVNTELAIFLLLPPAEGGYGFSANQTAAFTFTSWVALFVAQVFGATFNDRIPLWFTFRRKGTEHSRWHPEDRLWALLVGPAIIMPIGLGIVGAALQYHLHYMVLALGYFFVIIAAQLSVPVCMNYIVENFVGRAVESSIAMNAYRLSLGIGLGFFFDPWQRAVGVGWLFGTAAFLTTFSIAVLMLLIFYGEKIRRVTWSSSLAESEDGKILMND